MFKRSLGQKGAHNCPGSLGKWHIHFCTSRLAWENTHRESCLSLGLASALMGLQQEYPYPEVRWLPLVYRQKKQKKFLWELTQNARGLLDKIKKQNQCKGWNMSISLHAERENSRGVSCFDPISFLLWLFSKNINLIWMNFSLKLHFRMRNRKDCGFSCNFCYKLFCGLCFVVAFFLRVNWVNNNCCALPIYQHKPCEETLHQTSYPILWSADTF